MKLCQTIPGRRHKTDELDITGYLFFFVRVVLEWSGIGGQHRRGGRGAPVGQEAEDEGSFIHNLRHISQLEVSADSVSRSKYRFPIPVALANCRLTEMLKWQTTH